MYFLNYVFGSSRALRVTYRPNPKIYLVDNQTVFILMDNSLTDRIQFTYRPKRQIRRSLLKSALRAWLKMEGRKKRTSARPKIEKLGRQTELGIQSQRTTNKTPQNRYNRLGWV